jgi:pentatricopeptide repeat protein
MSLGSINQALMALDDMGNRWLSAEAALNSPPTHSKGHKGPRKLPSSSKAVNRCTKPSIEVINGAISALLRKKTVRMSHERRVKYVSDLLKWSANFQIRPDAYTYNNLIRLYMQGGDTATAYKILTQMERDGVQGDITTHNMLIAAAFDNGAFDGLTPDQQTTRILSIFNDLQAEGMKMSDTVYGTVIDRLLKDYDNYTTVLAVMSHMTERNFVPTAHTYTSFLTHYFQADPPNIRAVDGLVHYLFTSKRTHTDKVLYDRLIEGYARFGEVGSMMMVLVRMSKEGLQPGWDALTSAINALVHAGDYERARMVVRDVERGEGVAQGGIVGVNHGQHVFWATVRALGIDMDEARMGEFMSGGGGVLAERMDDWEGRKEPERGQFDQPSGQSRYEQEPGSVDYEREPGSVDFDPQQEPGQYAPELVYEQPQYEAAGASRVPPAMELPREPGAVAPEDEEDVHGFLTDEPEIEQKRQQRP